MLMPWQHRTSMIHLQRREKDECSCFMFVPSSSMPSLSQNSLSHHSHTVPQIGTVESYTELCFCTTACVPLSRLYILAVLIFPVYTNSSTITAVSGHPGITEIHCRGSFSPRSYYCTMRCTVHYTQIRDHNISKLL